jgi:hypothetical protein
MDWIRMQIRNRSIKKLVHIFPLRICSQLQRNIGKGDKNPLLSHFFSLDSKLEIHLTMFFPMAMLYGIRQYCGAENISALAPRNTLNYLFEMSNSTVLLCGLMHVLQQ